MTGSPFTVNFTARFDKSFEKLSQQHKLRVRRAVERIKTDPYQGRKLRNVEIGQYRWRVGDIRIRYDIEGTEITLVVVAKRADAYRRF